MKATQTRNKAAEFRQKMIDSQYAIVMSEIELARGEGETFVNLKGDDVLDPKVIEKLTKEDGFDIECVKGFASMISYTHISWAHAEEGRAGKFTKVNTKGLLQTHGLPALENLKKGGETFLNESKVFVNDVIETLKAQKDKRENSDELEDVDIVEEVSEAEAREESVEKQEEVSVEVENEESVDEVTISEDEMEEQSTCDDDEDEKTKVDLEKQGAETLAKILEQGNTFLGKMMKKNEAFIKSLKDKSKKDN